MPSQFYLSSERTNFSRLDRESEPYIPAADRDAAKPLFETEEEAQEFDEGNFDMPVPEYFLEQMEQEPQTDGSESRPKR